MEKQPTKGFMLVASFSKPYFDAAIHCADSIKDYYPEAKIALYTHEEWWDEKYRDIFDHVHLGVPLSLIHISEPKRRRGIGECLMSL